MGELDRVESFAMDSVAECLEEALAGIRLADMNWLELQHDSGLPAFDLHAESARLWTESVAERLQVWAKRARRIAAALEYHQARRLT